MSSQPRRFPTLSSHRCQSSMLCDTNSREDNFFSPPTLPYTLESVVENMNRNGSSGYASGTLNLNSSPSSTSQDTNIFQSPSSSSSSKASSKSPGGRMGQFFCGSYGQSDANMSASSVPLEDVLRWKEFRRRQKELQEIQLEGGDEELAQSLPNLDSLSLSSASNASSFDVVRRKELKEPYDLRKSPRRKTAVEIDPLGFPAKETNSMTEIKDETAASSMSEAPTEIASNTLFNRLLAKTDQTKPTSSVLGETTSPLPSSERQPPMASMNGSSRSKVDLRVNTSLAKPDASIPTSTRSIMSNMSTRSDTSARERFGEMKQRFPSGENAWDDTKPTLEIDTLNESSVKEESSLDRASSENNNDISMVSSNWDPLHVTTIEEGDEADDDSTGLDKTNIHGEIDDSFVDKESSDRGMQECKGVIDASPNSASSDVLMLSEVKSFMSKLDSLREEQRVNVQRMSMSLSNERVINSPPEQSELPSSLHNSQSVELKAENADDTYFQSLLEKKERLRQHKLESQRKRNELDERLKAMRNKLQSPSAVSRYGGESTNESMIVLDDSPTGKTPETESKAQSVVSPSIGARWSGGRAMWRSPGSSLEISPEVDSKTDARGTSKANFSEELFVADPSIKSPLHKVIKSMASISGGQLLTRPSTVYSTDMASKMTTSSNCPNTASSEQYSTASDNMDSFTKQIPFSPITADRKSTSKFSFSSLDTYQSSTCTTPSLKEPTLEDCNESPVNASQPSTSIPSTSPDASEGDKGGGLGFGYIFGDKSVASKSSSRFVELGQVDSSLKNDGAEEKSLVGVTVGGSKEKKKKIDDSSSGEGISNQARLRQSPKVSAPDPPGVESYDMWREDTSLKTPKKPANNLTIDCSNIVTNVAKKCEAELEKSDVPNELPQKTNISIQLPPLSPVAESTSFDDEFDAMIQKAKTISYTPRSCLNTPRSCLETPRANNTASLKSPRFRAERESKISALKSKFESQGLKTTYSDINWANQFSMESTQMWSMIMKESNAPTQQMPTVSQRDPYELTKPTTGWLPHSKPAPTVEPLRTLVPTLSDVKEELTQTDSLDSSLSSFKGLNIQELRSRFEKNDSLSVESNRKHKSSEKRMSMVTEEIETNEVIGPVKKTEVESNNCFTGDLSHPEVSKTKEVGSNETENSAKENIHDRASDSVFPSFSPVAVRKKAFEMRKQQSRIRAATPKKYQKSAVLACQSANVGNPEISPNTPSMAKSSTPRLSVKERVASFNSPNFRQGTFQMSHGKQLMPFQKLTPPPSSIQMSPTTEGVMFSPLESFGSPNHERKQQSKRQSAPLPRKQTPTHSVQHHAGYRNNQVRSVQTSFDSPGDEDDYDDGITLSPTCSEVSGLTLPTCLGSVTEDKPKAKYCAPDFKCMSPIARHRQKQGANGGTLFNHPYLRRMMSNVSTPRANGQHQEHSNNNQAAGPTHREQIISRVIEKPSTPRKPFKASPSKKYTTSQNKEPTRKSLSYQSTPTTSSSNLNEMQSPPHTKSQQSLSYQSTLTTASSNADFSNDDAPHSPQGKTQPRRKGKVAERVAMVNERTNRQNIAENNQPIKRIASRGAKEAKARYVGHSNNDEQSSTATRDCVRIN